MLASEWTVFYFFFILAVLALIIYLLSFLLPLLTEISIGASLSESLGSLIIVYYNINNQNNKVFLYICIEFSIFYGHK